MPSHSRRSHERRLGGVAPHDIVREDFEWLVAGTRLRTARLVEEALLMQSVEGHAHEGHAAFRRRRYVNTTMDDIVASLGRDWRAITRQRQGLIDAIAHWARRAIAGEAGPLLVTGEGECLLDMGLFRQIEIEPAAVLRGFYVGALRDDLEVRRRAEEKYDLRVGGGRSYLVDVEHMRRMRLNARRLAEGEHESQINYYREQGLIVGDECEREELPDDRVRYLYIRHRTGSGTSDDAAMLAAGKLFGPSGAIGAFLADAVDTLEKYASRCADQDDEIGRMIAEDWPGLAVSDEDLLLAVYLCAMPPSARPEVPDSSLRHLIEIDRDSDQTAFESHLAYVQQRPRAPMKLGSEEVKSEEFYRMFEEHFASAPR